MGVYTKIHQPTEDMRRLGDPFQNLANAIIVQAAKDYVYGDPCSRRSIEEFFRSQRFAQFSELDSGFLIDALKKEAAAMGRRRKGKS